MDNIIDELLSKDLRGAAMNLTLHEIRYLVDFYYIIQEGRKRAGNQVRDLAKAGEPHEFIQWTQVQFNRLENIIKGALGYWVKFNGGPVGDWCTSITGIGPVITAGLLTHIDITKAPTVGHIWCFAGLDPSRTWGKGEKRPWNASLKTLCWKIGESFVKVSGNENDFYGKIYAARKQVEQERNERLEFAEQAAHQLKVKNYKKTTEAYKHYIIGKLPPGHLHARAKRYAVKLFLSHYHGVTYRNHFGTEPPLPYPIAIEGHAHMIEAPGKMARS